MSGITPQEVTATATTDNLDVTEVVFEWYDPTAVMRKRAQIDTFTEDSGNRIFTDSFNCDTVGEWTIKAYYHRYDGTTAIELEAITIILVLVVNEYALGTIAAVLASLGAFVAYTRIKKPKNHIIR